MTQNKKRILIVEDDGGLREALINGLSQEFEFEEAADGQIALDWLKTNIPDLVLLDINLPKVDGMTVLKMIHQDKRTKNVPVIIISSMDDNDLVAQGLILGAKDYLAKANYTLADIAEMIRMRLVMK